MNELYEIVPIEGKGLGCIALKKIKKGSLILQEKPSCVANFDNCQSIINAFQCMTNNDQNEYLILHNRYENFKEFDWIIDVQSEFEAKIVGIYKTNAFDKGVGIKSSRFNHNCSANAELIWNDLKELIEIRTVSKINAGEEITVKYIQGYSKQSVNLIIIFAFNTAII